MTHQSSPTGSSSPRKPYHLWKTPKQRTLTSPFWWSKWEDDYLIANYNITSVEVICERLQRTHQAIKARAGKLNVVRKNKRFTSAELELLSQLSIREAMALTGRSKGSIIGKRWRLQKCHAIAPKAAPQAVRSFQLSKPARLYGAVEFAANAVKHLQPTRPTKLPLKSLKD